MAAGDPRRGRLRVAVSDERGRGVRGGTALGRWLARVAPARATGGVNVALVSNERVRALNRRYRRHDCTTDVLSFPADANSQFLVPNSESPFRQPFLGDIVIARGVARRQAVVRGHSEAAELRALTLHGLLHLLGFDHARDRGEMASLERRLRRKGGLRDGLLER